MVEVCLNLHFRVSRNLHARRRAIASPSSLSPCSMAGDGARDALLAPADDISAATPPAAAAAPTPRCSPRARRAAGWTALVLGTVAFLGVQVVEEVAMAHGELSMGPNGDVLQARAWADAPGPAYANVSEFGAKLIYAYLAERVDPVTQNNVGRTAFIYQNPDCPAWPPWSACTPGVVDSWLELARPRAAVNAQLNSQRRPLWPGTYRAVRLEFCKGGPDAPNFRFRAGAMERIYEFGLSVCGVTVELSPPLVVGAGDVVTVGVAYDLATLVAAGPAPTQGSGDRWPGCTPGDATGVSYCLQVNGSLFTPSASADTRRR